MILNKDDSYTDHLANDQKNRQKKVADVIRSCWGRTFSINLKEPAYTLKVILKHYIKQIGYRP